LCASACASCFSTEATNFCHVLSVFAHGDATFSPGLTSFFGRELVRIPSLVRDFPAFARYCALLVGVHSCKSSQLLRWFIFSLCHEFSSFVCNHVGKSRTPDEVEI
jgi:hypothetical protein